MTVNKKENKKSRRQTGIGIFKDRKISGRGEAGGQPGDGDGSTQKWEPTRRRRNPRESRRRTASDRAMSGPEPLGIPYYDIILLNRIDCMLVNSIDAFITLGACTHHGALQQYSASRTIPE